MPADVFYGEDLSFIHDAGHTRFVSESSRGLLTLLEEYIGLSAHVLDLGCGSGVWLRTLCDNGYAATGIDVSGAMVELARERAPDATVIRGSFFGRDMPRCDAVTAIGECFNYVLDEDESLEALLGRIYGCLRPGGVLIFDVAIPGRVVPGRERFWSQDTDWAVLSEASEDGGVLTRRITSYRRTGDVFRRNDETHTLRIRPADEILRLLNDAGFDARRVDSYGAQAFAPGYAGFVAKRSR